MDRRYQSMDFLRSAAIILVLLAHSVLSYGAPSFLAPLQLGGTGVDLFFVLSGWLLGSQLFKEIDRSGRIDVMRFWSRRWLRTFPAYYCILVLTVVQRYLTKDNIEFPWGYFIFVQNYQHPLEFFSISWSLCVEEQFYLLIAPVLAVSIGLKRGATLLLLVGALLTPCVLRMFGFYSSDEETHVRIDGCVMGVLLAFVHARYREAWNKLAEWAGWMALLGLSIYVFAYLSRFRHWGVLSNPDKLLLAFIFGSWVLVANANEKWRSSLSIPGAYYVATRSYSLYLLHPEVMAILRRFSNLIPFPIYFLLCVAGGLLISEVLYRTVEYPAMRLRERFAFSQ